MIADDLYDDALSGSPECEYPRECSCNDCLTPASVYEDEHDTAIDAWRARMRVRFGPELIDPDYYLCAGCDASAEHMTRDGVPLCGHCLEEREGRRVVLHQAWEEVA